MEEQIAAVRSLQRKWRDIGKVAHRVYAEINEAYNVACDKVYAKRAEQEAASERHGAGRTLDEDTPVHPEAEGDGREQRASG